MKKWSVNISYEVRVTRRCYGSFWVLVRCYISSSGKFSWSDRDLSQFTFSSRFCSSQHKLILSDSAEFCSPNTSGLRATDLLYTVKKVMSNLRHIRASLWLNPQWLLADTGSRAPAHHWRSQTFMEKDLKLTEAVSCGLKVCFSLTQEEGVCSRRWQQRARCGGLVLRARSDELNFII